MKKNDVDSTNLIINKINNKGTDPESHIDDLRLLSPYSPKFIKYINLETLRYLNKLSEFLISLKLSAEKARQESILSTMLEKYALDTKFEKMLFDNSLMNHENMQRLLKEQSLKIMTIGSKFNEAITFLAEEKIFLEQSIQKIDDRISQTEARLNSKIEAYGKILKKYSENILITSDLRASISLQLTEFEQSKIGAEVSNKIDIDRNDIQNIINNFANNLIDKKISLSNQSQDMQNEIRRYLKNEIKNTYKDYLSPTDLEIFAKRNMDTPEVGKAIKEIAHMINETIAQQDEKNNFGLQKEEESIAELMTDIEDLHKERDQFILLLERNNKDLAAITKNQDIVENIAEKNVCNKETHDELENTLTSLDSILARKEKLNSLKNEYTAKEDATNETTFRP